MSLLHATDAEAPCVPRRSTFDRDPSRSMWSSACAAKGDSQQVALNMEYDWRPEAPYVRAALADAAGLRPQPKPRPGIKSPGANCRRSRNAPYPASPSNAPRVQVSIRGLPRMSLPATGAPVHTALTPLPEVTVRNLPSGYWKFSL